ncbi:MULTISPECIES: hypothetical protein [Eikenella]|uniref:DUF995 domain-containing protein n=1 Tax=Eikenella longinqua TaxID=1795827 RepID=A0A1A9RWL2_9NEIS|nr:MULTISPECIES: hypothetical protein [Eikenella]OAM26801.1 hypothetical protein A7P95_08585 [Eikenella longinqua]
MKKYFILLLLSVSLSTAAMPDINFSGNWSWASKPLWRSPENLYSFTLNLIQQGNTVSGEWAHIQSDNIIKAHGKVRGYIQHGRLTLEYCTENSGNLYKYKPCPQYEQFNGYYVLQSDGHLQEYIQNSTKPSVYHPSLNYNKQ